MFLIQLHYVQPIQIIDQYLISHREFLEEGYKLNYFIVSGPKNPRTGGVIISQLQDRDQLEAILKQDPFYIHKVAEYELTEFIPIKYHQNFSAFICTE